MKAAKPDANGTPRLQLPYQPPEEYDFEIEFTPESGTNMVGQVLSAYQHSFEWLLDAQLTAGNKAGFNEIEGVHLANRTDGTTMRTKFLTNGQRHRSTVEVRRNRVRAMLDGEPLVTWGASPKSYERLEAWRGEKLRDALHLGLIAYDRGVRFHKITVREITGTGKVDAIATGASALVEKTDGLPPVITNWQDVTAATRDAARDAARNIPGLVVEQDAIRSSSKGSVNVPISPRNLRDCAVRLNHSGGGQIALRSNADGFLFVLCQSTQTIFKRYDKDLPDSASIGPSRLHAPGFD